MRSGPRGDRARIGDVRVALDQLGRELRGVEGLGDAVAAEDVYEHLTVGLVRLRLAVVDAESDRQTDDHARHEGWPAPPGYSQIAAFHADEST